MKRFTSLLLAVLMVVTMTSVSLLSVSAAAVSVVSVGMPDRAYFTGDGEKDAFEVSFDLELADGMTAIAGYEIEVTWDPALLSWGGIVFEGEGITATNVKEGSATVAAVNASDVLSGNLFTVTFVPLATGYVTVSTNVESMKSLASATGLVDAKGSKASVSVVTPVTIYETPEEIVNAAYELENKEYLSNGHSYQLTGVVLAVNTSYSEEYENITVTIRVGDLADKPIQCFRMKGEGVADLKVGDTITVTGQLMNYNGIIEFDANCVMDACVKRPENVKVDVNVNENKLLTDGMTDFDGDWAAVGANKVVLVQNTQCTATGMDVTLHYALGEVKTISGLMVDLYHCAGVMIGYPEGQATVLVSVDGESWTEMGKYDLVPAEVSGETHGTLCNVFNFENTEAAYVRVVLSVGASTSALGYAPADNKIFWEFISIAEFTVLKAHEHAYTSAITLEPTLSADGVRTYTCTCGDSYTEAIPAIKVQPDELVALPGDALVLDYAGYIHDSFHCILAGGHLTIDQLTALGNNGSGKDMNYFYVIVVNAHGVVEETHFVLGGPDGDKSDVVCPVGGYIIGFSGSKEDGVKLTDIEKGAVITLYNVDLIALRGAAGHVTVEGAGFTYKNPVKIYETDEEILGAAYGLAEGETLSDGHPYQLSGVVLSVDADGSVTIQVGQLKDYPRLCVRLTGEGAADLAVGDTITVKGAIKNDAGKIGVVDGALLEVVKAPTVAFGDIDGDGKVGKLDYFKLKTFLMDKPINFTDEMLSRSDIDGSGKVNKKDYFQLRLYLLGKWSPAE